MIRELIEHDATCPFCGEPIDLLIDISAGDSSYVEDCQVCCRPMQIRIVTTGDELQHVSVDVE
ncbi:MAG: CPXCG motif-containing cysteine-rich protein [Pseudomonadota bacterium]